MVGGRVTRWAPGGLIVLIAGIVLAGCAAPLRIDDRYRAVSQDSRVQFIVLHYTGIDFDRSLQRLKVDAIDLVQFHWWDYAQPRWLEALGWLDEARVAGKVRNVGGTNFDTAHVEAILAAGIPLASLQVQYSLLDHRPEKRLAALCERRGVALLCYGSVAGGFLGDRWLGAAEPAGELENRSLVKYKLIIDDFGGWAAFQRLLRALRRIADRHGADLASVASRYVLDRPGVAAVIVGARSAAHVAANAGVFAFSLDAADRAEIAGVLAVAAALGVGHQRRPDGVDAGGDRLEQAAARHHR